MKTLLSLGAICLVAACSDGNPYSNPTPARDLSVSPPDLIGTDMVGFQVVEQCNFVDFNDDTSVSGPIAVTPWDPSLGKKCILIKVGQTVTWASSTDHPLESTTGTTPTPIPANGATTAQSIKFTSVGVYGYQCQVHTSLMHGAIWVVP